MEGVTPQHDVSAGFHIICNTGSKGRYSGYLGIPITEWGGQTLSTCGLSKPDVLLAGLTASIQEINRKA